MRRYLLIVAALALLSSCKSDHPAAPQEIQLPASIAFMHSKNAENEQDLYLLDSKGNEHPLVVVDGDHRRPSWAPNGLRIAFASVRGYASEIYLVNPDGTDERNITNIPAWDERQVWSPDGKMVAFEANSASLSQIQVVRPDGSGLLQLTQGPEANWFPKWSPRPG